MLTFNHFNFNVLDMERSLAFYRDALHLTPCREKRAADGSFRIVFLQDEAGSPFSLELTELADRKEAYDLGEGSPAEVRHRGRGVPSGFPHPGLRRRASKAPGDGHHLLREPVHGHLLHRRPGRLLDRDHSCSPVIFPKTTGPAANTAGPFPFFSIPPRYFAPTSTGGPGGSRTGP